MALVCSFASSSSSSRIRISVCGNERGRRLAMAITSFVYRLPIALHIHSSHIHEGAHHQQQNHPTEHQTQEQNQQQNRPLPKRLVPIPITRRSNHTLVARPFVSQKPILISDTIRLTELEFRLFTTLKSVLGYYNLKTQLRVAGGWVRDKVVIAFVYFLNASIYMNVCHVMLCKVLMHVCVYMGVMSCYVSNHVCLYA